MKTIAMKPGVIYAYCSEVGISRDELSRRMGVATSTAFRVEKGTVGPSPRFIAALMAQTGRSFEDLFELVPEVAA
jgi:transcriptional regulator with XRE-family HTH domain